MIPQTECDSDTLTIALTGFSSYKNWSKKFTDFHVCAGLKYWHSVHKMEYKGIFKENEKFDLRLERSIITLENLCKLHGWTSKRPLTVFCAVTLVPIETVLSAMEEAKFAVTEIVQETIADDLCCDLEIVCDDESVIKVHQHILELKCPALKKALQQQQADVLKFSNMKARAVKEFIRFIYTNTLKDIDGIEPNLIEFAKRFEVPELAEKTFAKIMETITNKTAVNILIMAHENNFHQLEMDAIEFIIEKFQKIRQDESWKLLTNFPQILMEIFSRVNYLG